MKSDKPSRPFVTARIGASVAAAGLLLCLSARTLSRPGGTNSWAPGSWEATDWAYWERTWGGIGMALLVGGLVIVAFGLYAWCRNDADRR